MAKCKSCGKHGLFLKLNSGGLCEDCEIIKEIKSKPSATSNDVNKLQSARARVYGTDLLEAT
nr:MAG TPA: cysteine-rich protein [Caudoviricetes sp.]